MFGLFNWMNCYQAFVILTLITETNSIFLHVRKLLQLSGVKITNYVYIVNNVLNVVTFFVCRVCGQLYMMYCSILTASKTPLVSDFGSSWQLKSSVHLVPMQAVRCIMHFCRESNGEDIRALVIGIWSFAMHPSMARTKGCCQVQEKMSV